VASDLTGRGLVRGILVLALLWWSWVGYAWLANLVQAEEGWGRATMLAAMAAMFVLAVGCPRPSTTGRAGRTGRRRLRLPGGASPPPHDDVASALPRHHFLLIGRSAWQLFGNLFAEQAELRTVEEMEKAL
jgi:hypothetical protein